VLDDARNDSSLVRYLGRGRKVPALFTCAIVPLEAEIKDNRLLRTRFLPGQLRQF
jgi:hypothetical protein